MTPLGHSHGLATLPKASPSSLSLNDMNSSSSNLSTRSRSLRLLVAATGPRDTSWAQALVVRLSKNPHIEMRAIVDDVVPRLNQTVYALQNRSLTLGPTDRSEDVEFYKQQAFELVDWADMMVCVPLDADGIAKLVAGMADTFLSEVLRGWDQQKRIVLVPGMSTHMWANPMTKKHMSRLHRKWPWIRPLAPILWHYEGAPHPKRVANWNGFNEVLGIIKNQADILGLGREIDLATGVSGLVAEGTSGSGAAPKLQLPPEIWTMILNFAGDWELAKSLGVYTTLAMPSPWSIQPREPNNPLSVYAHELEWTVLLRSSATICKKLSQSPPNFVDLPAVVVRLVIKFGLVEVMAYMEANRPDLFKAFEGTVLPTKATVFYPRTVVLDYWKNSRWFRDRRLYDFEAIDGASKNGHVHVLEWWWRQSGLPLLYTEASLEQASAKGHLLVLEWWREAAAQDDRVVLRPGRSLLWASQYGQADVIRWWDASGIPVAHGDGIAKVASRWGQVEVLETWRRLKGDNKIVFDEEVLINATTNQHIGVLDWWRKFAHGELEGMEGRRQVVEFRTCNIEEALEDSIGDQSQVRRWWSSHGLNLGLRNYEWMKTRYL